MTTPRGVTTSEFYASALASGALFAIAVLDSDWRVRRTALIVGGMIVLAYVVGRIILKRSGICECSGVSTQGPPKNGSPSI